MQATAELERKMDDERSCMDALAANFGYGTQPHRREDLYRRIAIAIKRYRLPAWRIVCEVAGEAKGKDLPDRYFCKAVHTRLREAGMWDGDAVELF